MGRKTLVRTVIIAYLLTILIPLSARASAASGGNGELRNLALGLSYESSISSNATYPDTGNKLTDGQIAGTNFKDEKWTGYLRGEETAFIFDLGVVKSVNQIKANALHYLSTGISLPRHMTIYISEDGEHWGQLLNRKTDPDLMWMTGSSKSVFQWDGATDGLPPGNAQSDIVLARYVKVSFQALVWLFIDEIEIWGTDGQAPTAVHLQPDYNAPAGPLGYGMPGAHTGNINDLVLIYNGYYASGVGNWKKEDLIPYISYVDSSGNPLDRMFDGVTLLGLKSQRGRTFVEDVTGTGAYADKVDWQWYLDKTFAPNGDMAQLNEAAREVAVKLGDSGFKPKVSLMIPYPSMYLTDFGDVDGDGISENFSPLAPNSHKKAYENKRKVLKWYIDQAMAKWNAGGYDHLDFGGMYWMNEFFSVKSSYETEMMQSAADLVHQYGGKFFWIPYYHATDLQYWFGKELGFDAVTVQSNYFFGRFGDNPDRHLTTMEMAKRHGMSMEIENDTRMTASGDEGLPFRNRLIQYYNEGVNDGYMQAFNVHYQGTNAYVISARSADPEVRNMYDLTYQYVKGTYIKQPILTAGNANSKNDMLAYLDVMSEYVLESDASSINRAFANDLAFRVSIIGQLLETDDKQDALAYMDDFVAHINDAAVRAQHLLSAAAAPMLNTMANVFIQRLS